MTCICGMVRDGEVYMAGDLMGSNGFTGKVYPDSKVFVNGDFIIGYTSSFRMGQLLEWNWEQPLRQEGITDRQYMQLNVVESLRETFALFGYGVKEGLESIGGNFLIGYKGNLYEMQENFSLLKVEDYAAVGSGQYHAESVLHLLYPDESLHPFSIMQTAIGSAAHFTQSVSYECTLYSSDENAEEGWNKLMEEQQNAYLEAIQGEPLPKKALEPLDKETLIKVIRGELSEEEEVDLFGDYIGEDGVCGASEDESLTEEEIGTAVPHYLLEQVKSLTKHDVDVVEEDGLKAMKILATPSEGHGEILFFEDNYISYYDINTIDELPWNNDEDIERIDYFKIMCEDFGVTYRPESCIEDLEKFHKSVVSYLKSLD